MEEVLKEKVCFVTGTDRGLGKEIALKCAKEGGKVYANCFRAENAYRWLSECNVKANIVPLEFDMTDSTALRNAVMQIKKMEGHIDVLVNNAGIVSYEPLGMVSKTHLEQMFAVNVYALFEAMQLVSRVMERHGGGSIVNIASVVGEEGASGQTAYAASKGAVIAITKSSAKELVAKNIRVNAVAPGMIGTERLLHEMENRFPHMKEKIGMGRVARPEEIADAVIFLASDKSSYITGQVLKAEGCSSF